MLEDFSAERCGASVAMYVLLVIPLTVVVGWASGAATWVLPYVAAVLLRLIALLLVCLATLAALFFTNRELLLRGVLFAATTLSSWFATNRLGRGVESFRNRAAARRERPLPKDLAPAASATATVRTNRIPLGAMRDTAERARVAVRATAGTTHIGTAPPAPTSSPARAPPAALQTPVAAAAVTPFPRGSVRGRLQARLANRAAAPTSTAR
jgi:hypothetical protein